MGKQSFLNGGYIGKLGQTVGQRWKNIKTIRSYVIPHNPKTPEQQANRSVFAHAVKLAQDAMAINGHTGIWDTSTTPEFSQRCGQAMKKLKEGATDQQALPLFPDGKFPEKSIAILGYEVINAEKKIRITFSDFGLTQPYRAKIKTCPAVLQDGQKITTFEIEGDVRNNIFTSDTINLQNFDTIFKSQIISFRPTFYLQGGYLYENIQFQDNYWLEDVLSDFDQNVLPVMVNDNFTMRPSNTVILIESTIAPFTEENAIISNLTGEINEFDKATGTILADFYFGYKDVSGGGLGDVAEFENMSQEFDVRLVEVKPITIRCSIQNKQTVQPLYIGNVRVVN